MSSDAPLPLGTVGWQDLTVDNAGELRQFYEQVVGWRSEEYCGDFNLFAPGSDKPVAGICHARGVNTGLPAQWLIYIVVEDAAAAAKNCVELGGRIIKGPTVGKAYSLCVIRDPAGAYCVLYSQTRQVKQS